MRVGIAGLDENKRLEQFERARFGMAGAGDRTLVDTAASVGIAGLDRASKVAAAGVNTRQIEGAAMYGIAGNLGSSTRQGFAAELADVAGFRERDERLAGLTRHSNRLGDRAAREAWQRGCFFSDFTYVCTPYEETETGGYRRNGTMRWRRGRDLAFDRSNRSLPLLLDSAAYRRFTGTAPGWAGDVVAYIEAIELADPDGYAAYDHIDSRERSLADLDALRSAFPGDERLWPVFSCRWTWRDDAHLDFARLPGWRSTELASLIPLNRTQKPLRRETRERMARQAIANALRLAEDPDFLDMVERHGKVMIGGMVKGPCSRYARHLYAATLCALFPGVQFWLLGQANFAVVNGLGMLGLLERVWTDGSWWILDSTAERFAVVEGGLITMHSFESDYRQQTFFTLVEMMAANLRSLLAAYQGLWAWPPPEPLPLDLLDGAQAVELKARLRTAQLELGL
jgi:hypothetical protein